MACEIISIGQVGDCVPNEGGIVKSFLTKLSSITSVTITAGVITNFTMSGVGLWEEFIYDRDSTANFNQVSSRNGKRITIEQTAFMKFGGISQAYLTAVNRIIQCCDIVAIHVLANGTRVVQGIEEQAATGAPLGTKNQQTRVLPTVNTDVSTNEARVEYTVGGNSDTFTMTTSLSDSAILAL